MEPSSNNNPPPILCARIQGRLHSIGDMVFISSLGCNGTLLKFQPGFGNYCVVIPHDKGQVQTYQATELEKGCGINTANRIWLRNNHITVNDHISEIIFLQYYSRLCFLKYIGE